jgi:ArsR family metal-binding transcriptional regulator
LVFKSKYSLSPPLSLDGNDHPLSVANPKRNPLLAEEMLKIACKECYAPACHNLAVMYRNGDTDIPSNMKLHEDYKHKTLSLMDERKQMNKVLKKNTSSS